MEAGKEMASSKTPSRSCVGSAGNMQMIHGTCWTQGEAGSYAKRVVLSRGQGAAGLMLNSVP